MSPEILDKFRFLPNLLRKRLYCERVRNVFCEKSQVNPQNLPLLPIPKLDYTLTKFLKSAEPFATPCELETARDVCRKFCKNEGRHLQNLLVERARERDNWLDEWYLKCSYLYSRDGLPMNTSPVLVLPNENFDSRCAQLNHAAKIIQGLLKFRRMCLDNEIPPESWGKHPLDMSVYKKLFSFIRTPRLGCDHLLELPANSRHIIVAYNNNFFKIVVLDEEGVRLSFTQLLSTLEDVLELGHSRGDPVGILTFMKRDKWAETLEEMKSVTDNVNHLKDIEDALFVVCLDECSPNKMCTSQEKRSSSVSNGFHGHGPATNAANRWYDKTLQVFVSLDGSIGLIFEHSPVDAHPLAKLADFLVSYVKSDEFLNIPFANLYEKPKRLCFICTDEIKSDIQDGCLEAQEKSRTFASEWMEYDGYGTDFCKEHRMDADALVQIALQQAHVKTHGHFAPQQEIASTRKFYLGRNDLIRSCTCEMVRFIKSIDDTRILLQDRFDLLKEAVKVHGDLSVDAMEGRAVDCHLFGLMMACREAGLHLSKVFQSRAYLKSGKFKILSIQVPMESDSLMCYPPSCHGGYGVCYNPRKENFHICVTCKKNDCDTNSKKLSDFWGCGMKKLSEILCRYRKKKGKIST